MNSVSPHKEEYETHDGLTLAKDIAWVIKTLWGGVFVVVLAAVWVAALAGDVKSNTAKIDDAATAEQVQQVLAGLKEIKDTLKDQDLRQRAIKTQVDKLGQEVEDIKKRDE